MMDQMANPDNKALFDANYAKLVNPEWNKADNHEKKRQTQK